MNKTSSLKKKIFSEVKKFYDLEHRPKAFVPGMSAVPYAGRVFDASEMISLTDAALDFWLTTGRFARVFEDRMARFLGVKNCLLTNSGSSANLLAVCALTSPLLKQRRINPGDEVITTACGFPTTLNPILQNQLVPVFVDIALGTYNADVAMIKKAFSKKTKAIFLPHTLGNPCEIEKIAAFARKNGLWLIEDNCDALGSLYNGKYTGTYGDMATLSFYPAHHITMGEGGAVLTSNPLLNKIIISLRDWGRDCWCEPGIDNSCGKRFSWKSKKLPFGYDHKYIYSHVGYNLKATDLQAAIGCAQMKKLPQFIKMRQRNFKFLLQHLKPYERYLLMPRSPARAEPSWFGFPILVKKNKDFSRRDIVGFLEKNKIATRMLFGGNLLRQPAYENIRCRIASDLKNTDLVMEHLFWIGVYPGLNKAMLKYVSDTFYAFFRSL
jgi:CDP-6-deoxy-D-xylo-4-hexulose-3-dehydrase